MVPKSGKGLIMLKMKHEKGVRYFMVPKSGVGRAWESSRMKHEGFGCFMVPKSGVGRVWEGQT